MTEFKKFRVGDLFEVVSGKKIFHADYVIPSKSNDLKNVIAYIVRSTLNNGVKCYTDRSLYADTQVNSGNVITFAQDSFIAYYQPSDFIVGNKVKILKLLDDNVLNESIGLYLVTAINKIILGNTWGEGSTVESISNLRIQLPVTSDGSPDWLQMESLVELVQKQHVELVQKQHVELVQKLLCEAGFSSLEDTVLTDDEEKLLESWKVAQTKSKRSASAPVPSALRMNTVKLGDLFEIKTVVGVNINDLCKGNSVNYVTRTSSNRGVHSKVGFTKFAHLIPNNTFSLGLLQMDAFYQANSYYVGQFVRYISPKFDLNLNVALYFETIFNSMKDLLLAGSVSDVNELFLSHTVLIPTDFEVIDSLGGIFKKLSVRDLRQSLDEQLSKY